MESAADQYHAHGHGYYSHPIMPQRSVVYQYPPAPHVVYSQPPYAPGSQTQPHPYFSYPRTYCPPPPPPGVHYSSNVHVSSPLPAGVHYHHPQHSFHHYPSHPPPAPAGPAAPMNVAPPQLVNEPHAAVEREPPRVIASMADLETSEADSSRKFACGSSGAFVAHPIPRYEQF